MKNNAMIASFADLDREELRVKKRLKKQEEEIKQRISTLPEDLVTAGITKIVTSILNGELLKSAISIFKTVGNVFSENKNEGSEKGGILNLIKTIIKNKLSD
jgi:hypothetical protein